MKHELLGGLDPESSAARERTMRALVDPPFEGIQSVLVVLTSDSQSLDMPALELHVQATYKGADVFFEDASGKAMEKAAPKKVDLLIDFGHEGERVPASLLRRRFKQARFSVGRMSSVRKPYNRLVEESKGLHGMEREKWMQALVLKKAGIVLAVDAPAKEDLSGLPRYA